MKTRFWILLVICRLLATGQSNFVHKGVYLPGSYSSFAKDIMQVGTDQFVIIGHSYDSIGGNLVPRLSIVGCDGQGNFQWKKSYGSANFVYYTPIGAYRGLTRLGLFLYTSLYAVDSTNKSCGVLMKFDLAGNLIWKKLFYDTNPTVFMAPTSIGASIDGNLLVTGYKMTQSPGYNNHSVMNSFLIKADTNGNTVWEKSYFCSNLDNTLSHNDVIQDHSTGKIILVGANVTNSIAHGSILFLDSTGNKINEIILNAQLNSGLINLIQTSDMNFVAVGLKDSINSNMDILSQPYMVKFDISGNIIFENNYDSLSFSSSFGRIVETSNGDIITAGTSEKLFTRQQGINVQIRLLKTDPQGKLIWQRFYDDLADSSNEEVIYGMNLTFDGGLVFTSFVVTPQKDIQPYKFNRTTVDEYDPFACSIESLTGINQISNEKVIIELYPNPTMGSLSIKGDYSSINGIYNLLGQKMDFKQTQKSNETLFELINFPQGTYFLVLEDLRGNLIKKSFIVSSK